MAAGTSWWYASMIFQNQAALSSHEAAVVPAVPQRHAAAPRGGGEGGAGAGAAAAGAAAAGGPQVPAGAGKPAKWRIFTFWDYAHGANAFVNLNVASWRAHAPPGTEIVLVNNSNFKKLVPDAPEEWYRLPYAAAKSDVVRAAVLYHQGGLYMDTDFLVLNPLQKVFDKLDEGWDVVAYEDGKSEGAPSGDCSGTGQRYSSNFLAARPGNPWSRTWWENIKQKLTRLCGEGEFAVEKICCHEAFAKEPERRACHIPWAQIEHLKTPENDHDSKGPPRKDPTQGRNRNRDEKEAVSRSPEEEERVLEKVKEGSKKAALVPWNMTKVYCFKGNEGMAAHVVGQIYWQPWSVETKATDPSQTNKVYNQDFDCKEEPNGDLACKRGNWGKWSRTYGNFFGRVAYHLFFSTHRGAAKTKEEILSKGWLVSEMYRRGLGDLLDNA